MGEFMFYGSAITEKTRGSPRMWHRYARRSGRVLADDMGHSMILHRITSEVRGVLGPSIMDG
jgi:hypothetical protein